MESFLQKTITLQDAFDYCNQPFGWLGLIGVLSLVFCKPLSQICLAKRKVIGAAGKTEYQKKAYDLPFEGEMVDGHPLGRGFIFTYLANLALLMSSLKMLKTMNPDGIPEGSQMLLFFVGIAIFIFSPVDWPFVVLGTIAMSVVTFFWHYGAPMFSALGNLISRFMEML